MCITREVGVRDENWLDRIHPVAQDRIQWRTFVTVAINLRVPIAIELVSITLYSDFTCAVVYLFTSSEVTLNNNILKYNVFLSGFLRRVCNQGIPDSSPGGGQYLSGANRVVVRIPL